MKIYLYLLIGITFSCILSAHDEKKKIDPVGGREIVELDEGRAYILTDKNWNTQLEISITDKDFGICMLTDKGKIIPFTVLAEDGTITTSRAFGNKKVETSYLDRDGDGLPEIKMTLDRSGDEIQVKVEDIHYTFTTVQPSEE